MIGLDTNILVRLTIRDDQTQWEKVTDALKALKESYFVSILVVLEWQWVIQNVYRIPVADTLRQLQLFLQNEAFIFENQEVLEESLVLAQTEKADFADILIGLCNRRAGCDTTLTFDKAASTLDSFTQLA